MGGLQLALSKADKIGDTKEKKTQTKDVYPVHVHNTTIRKGFFLVDSYVEPKNYFLKIT